jgi:hypothetical protein
VGRVLSCVRVEALPVAEGLVGHESNGEQYTPIVSHLTLAGHSDLGLDPLAIHTGCGEDEKKFVPDADGCVYLLVKLLAALDVMRGKPATHALIF